MFISGLQENDIPQVDARAGDLLLKKELQKSQDGWQGLVYLKPNA